MMEWEPDDEHTDDGQHDAGYQEPREPKKPSLLFWFFVGLLIGFICYVGYMLLTGSHYFVK